MILSTFFLNTNLYEKQISFQSNYIFYTEHRILLCIQHTQNMEFITYLHFVYILFRTETWSVVPKQHISVIGVEHTSNINGTRIFSVTGKEQ